MSYKLFSVYDRLSHLYGNPFVQVNDSCAKRYFQSIIVKSPDMPASDYDLMYVGEWFPETGVLLQNQSPSLIVNGGELVE